MVVCDGFTGNVALKTLEGTIRSVLEALRDEIRSSARATLGGLLIRPAARGLRARLDPETYGGGYLLGLRGLVVIAHGSSSRVAIANATRMAARGVEHRLVERLAERLPATRAESRAAATAAALKSLFLGLPLRDPSRPEAGFAGREASLGQSVHSAEEGGSWWKHGFPHASPRC